MTWIIAFVAAAIAFGILDAIWLGWAGENFYRPRLGDMLADSFRMGPALVFYALYVAAIVWFAVRPGLAGGVGAAALNGALLGAICYATYDLTNQATLKQWSTTITIVDICWGAFATAIAASVATFVVSKFA
ncbi:DUF2177 family protein [Qipengyuania vesicularis]|uniref:DUF2177 family protein n=1 Tax=Qipengyuania vesicularis TaxID=2867232 RepID=UPI001C88823B|nr:DUF2177 family protein [Qipengyuania vesicularis]MBX7527082.1 DUF2177 family protein [Qipengyuania vesicularis]